MNGGTLSMVDQQLCMKMHSVSILYLHLNRKYPF